MIQFGLKDLSELPSLKEFEEIRRMALFDSEPAADSPAVETPAEPSAASSSDPEIASERQAVSEPEAEAGAGSEPPRTVER
jgi:segregation and condensation protein B